MTKRKDGCICDSPSKLKGIRKNQYIHWDNMLKRVYSSNYKAKKPTYSDVTICDEWRYFSNFEKWFNSQIYKEDFELDKDIIFQGNKEYSPNTCCLVPRYINLVIRNKNNNNTTGYGGVSMKKNGRYRVTCREALTKKQKFLGTYDDPKEAFDIYKAYKEEQIKIVAEYSLNVGDIDIRIYNALINYTI